MAARESHMLDVHGARLHYEVRGSGPTLLLIPGSNGDAGFFDGMADRLADRYTVLSYDRRGFSRSTAQEEGRAGWIETHTEDARRLLDAAAAPAYVFGTSAGAIIGLALIARHPDKVVKLVAHEPPLAELLPDAARWQAFFEGVGETYRSQGTDAAMRQFMTGIGLDDTAQRPAEPDLELIGRMPANFHTILTQEVPNAPIHRPDLAALDAQHARITLAGGHDSRAHFPYRPAVTLAGRWDRQVIDFPGDHLGYWSRPAEFAGALVRAMEP